MQQECFYKSRLQPPTDRLLSPRESHRMWVIYGRVPFTVHLVARFVEGVPARASRQSAAAHQLEHVDGDYHDHRHVLMSGVGGAHDDRRGWTPN